MKEKDGPVNLSHTTPWGPLASSEIPQRAFLLFLLPLFSNSDDTRVTFYLIYYHPHTVRKAVEWTCGVEVFINCRQTQKKSPKARGGSS